ncbi:MAG: hypothetical protein IJN94_06695 [Clostridia bacterium]|nr:hypothetical protein [Clostridia bacterium]
MKIAKRVLSIMMAIVTLISIVSISAEALTVEVEDRDYGYMVPVNNKGTKVISTVKLYGNYDYINFYIHSGFAGNVYFFYEIYSDKSLTKCIDSGYTVCYYGNYNMSEKIKLKGKYKSKTYYAVTYAGVFSSKRNSITIDKNSMCQFKVVVDRSPSFEEKVVPLKRVTNTINGPKITWANISGATKYYIYRRKVGSTKMTKIGAVGSGKNTFVDTAIKRKDGNYIYTVKGINKSGKASRYLYNGLTCLYAEAPTINTASVIDNNAIYLEWKKTDGDARYYIYRKIDNGDWERVEDCRANYYTDKNVENSKTYSYRVKSIIDYDDDGKAKSAYSKVAGNIKFLEAPVMNELEVNESSIEVSWNSVEGATGYSILRKPLDTDDEWTVLATVSGKNTTYEDTTAKLNKGYLYTVRSEGKGFSGSYSSGKDYFTLAEPEFTVNVEDDGIRVEWPAVPYATSYRVYEQNEDGTWSVKFKTKKLYYEFNPRTYYNKKLSVCACRSSGGLSTYKTDVEPTIYFQEIPFEITEYETYTMFDWSGTEADSYRVYRKRRSESAADYKLYYESSTCGFSDYSPVENVAYTYQIRAVYGDVEQYDNIVSKSHTRYSPERCVESFKVIKDTEVTNYHYKTGDKVKEYYDFKINKTDTYKKSSTYIYYLTSYSKYTDGWKPLGNVYSVKGSTVNYGKIDPLRFSCVVKNNYGNSTPIGTNVAYANDESCEAPIVTLTPTKNGLKMTWDAVDGAVEYDVDVYFTRRADYSKTIKADGSKTYTINFNDVTSDYYIEVRITAVHKNGNKTTRNIGRYIYYIKPSLITAGAKNGDIKVMWDGEYYDDLQYAVLRKAEGESKWTRISKKAYEYKSSCMLNGKEYFGFVYTDTTAKKGVKYTYTVRLYDPNTKEYVSYYDTKGVSAKR